MSMTATLTTKVDIEAKAAAAALVTKKSDLQAQIDTLDFKSIRSSRAIAAGTATDADKTKLADIEAQVVALRAQLVALGTN